MKVAVLLVVSVGCVLLIPPVNSMETCYNGVVSEIIVNQNSTYLQTPNYPNGYPNNFRCGVRLISSNGVDTINIRVLNSSVGNVEDSSSCTLDFAEIFDGHDPSFTKLTQWCGDSTPTVTTSGPYAFFYFETDATITDEGVHLEFTTGTLDPLPTEAPVIATTQAPDNSGAIAGGVIGGLIGLAALVVGIVFLVLYCIKKSKSKVDSEKIKLKPTAKAVAASKGETNVLVISEKPDKTMSVDSRPQSQGYSRPQSEDRTRPQSRFSQSGRNSRLMTANSFSETADTPGTLTPAFSPTPPRTPKGSVRFIESRLRLNADMGSPATPPPSHREILRSSAITIGSISSSISKARAQNQSDTPVIDEIGVPDPE